MVFQLLIAKGAEYASYSLSNEFSSGCVVPSLQTVDETETIQGTAVSRPRRQPRSPLLWNRSQGIQGLHSYSCGTFMLPLVLPPLYRCLDQWELLDENPCWLSHSQTGSTVFVGTNDQARGTTNGNQTLCQLWWTGPIQMYLVVPS